MDLSRLLTSTASVETPLTDGETGRSTSHSGSAASTTGAQEKGSQLSQGSQEGAEDSTLQTSAPPQPVAIVSSSPTGTSAALESSSSSTAVAPLATTQTPQSASEASRLRRKQEKLSAEQACNAKKGGGKFKDDPLYDYVTVCVPAHCCCYYCVPS